MDRAEDVYKLQSVAFDMRETNPVLSQLFLVMAGRIALQETPYDELVQVDEQVGMYRL